MKFMKKESTEKEERICSTKVRNKLGKKKQKGDLFMGTIYKWDNIQRVVVIKNTTIYTETTL
jgi:hypothetical protein